MRLELGSGLAIRSWEHSDASSLVAHANDRDIWRNLRDAFPHPYNRRDAESYIAMVCDMSPENHFAVAVEGAAVGGIGLRPGEDVERFSAEIGYWLGREYWGRGIMTRCLAAMTEWGFSERRLARVFALPYSWNTSSVRVLEKCGYRLEGRLRRSAHKDGVFVDQLVYAILNPSLEGSSEDVIKE